MSALRKEELAAVGASPTLAAALAVPALELRGVHKGFGRGTGRSEVLSGVDLTIGQGEFVAVVGFSGSGKTTLVNLLAGLSTPDRGQALKGGRPIVGPGPDRGIVFQSYSLMPWLTVGENVALAVDRVSAQRSAAERAERVRHYVKLVGLSAAIDKKPAQLSGGMRQRVSVARALATEPDTLLLDEPLSALDALTRAQLQDEILQIWSADPDDRKSVLMITNDVDEALMERAPGGLMPVPERDSAPARIARTLLGISPRPVRKMIASGDPRAASSCCMSRPDAGGIDRSSTTQPCAAGSCSSKNRFAESKHMTVCPVAVRSRRSARSTGASSSTT